jgi:DNA-binding NarL/FixJ family response regulator
MTSAAWRAPRPGMPPRHPGTGRDRPPSTNRRSFLRAVPWFVTSVKIRKMSASPAIRGRRAPAMPSHAASNTEGASPGGQFSVLVVEDERVLWRGYRARLPELAPCFAASLAEARALLARNEYDVVLLDLKLGDEDGMSLLDDMAALSRRPGVVVVSGHLTAERLLMLYRQRILALPKRADDVVLREAIATAAERPSYPEIVRMLCRRHGLSRSETEVVLLTAQGKSIQGVAEALGCQPRTVDSHWQGIFNKTGYRSKPDVLAAVLRLV